MPQGSSSRSVSRMPWCFSRDRWRFKMQRCYRLNLTAFYP